MKKEMIKVMRTNKSLIRNAADKKCAITTELIKTNADKTERQRGELNLTKNIKSSVLKGDHKDMWREV